MNIKNQKWMTLLCATALACGGGGGGDDEVTEENAARTEGGEVIAGAAGAVSEEAHNHWLEAQQMYAAAAEEGWNEQNCSRVRAKFDAAIDAQGNFAEALYMAGLVAEECNDADGARRHYTNALQVAERAQREREGRGPGNGALCKARVALGLLDLQRGQRGPAQQAFQRAVREDPQCTSGYTNLAIMQREAGGPQVAEALRNLRRALAIESDYLPAFNQMALLHYGRGKEDGGAAALDLAEVVCRQAQLIDRNYAPIYNTWGLIKIETGDVIEALRYFERAIQLDDSMFEAQMNFGAVTISFRGYEDARRSFARAVELRPNDYEAHLGLGAALRGLSQFDAAKAEYERAMEIDANRPESHFNIGVLYHNYLQAEGMEATIANLTRAKTLFETFVAKAGNNRRYAESVELVTNRCRERRQRRGRRGRRARRNTSQWVGDCRPGRIQVIEITIAALREGMEMQAEAERMQREAERQQQQQQQQQPEGGGGE